MSENNNKARTSRKMSLVSDGPLNLQARRLAGLIRLHSDLMLLREMVEKAHPEIDDYDSIELNLIFDSSGVATEIASNITIWEPFKKSDLCLLLDLINIAQTNLTRDINQLATKIIDEYNKDKVSNRQLILISSIQDIIPNRNEIA
jgi:hypothetical protein